MTFETILGIGLLLIGVPMLILQFQKEFKREDSYGESVIYQLIIASIIFIMIGIFYLVR